MKKYLPKKFRNHGLHIWCSKCKKVVTNQPCTHVEKQKFQSRIYNPISKKQDCIKTHDTGDATEAWKAHQEYREYLVNNNYRIPKKLDKTEIAVPFIKGAVQEYLDFLQDIDVPTYAHKNLTKQYINDESRHLTRLLESFQKVSGKVSNLPIESINSSHVDSFVKKILDLNLSDRSYNAYIKSARAFFNHCLTKHRLDMENPFKVVRTHHIHEDPTVITVEEFERLLSVITPENSKGTKGKKKETVNYYKPWLKKAFIFSLLVGERLDGITLLKWHHVEGNFLKIPNFKNNRIHNTNKFISHTPITKDLAEILIELDIDKSEPDDYILAPEIVNRNTLKSFLSKSFSHFWSYTGSKKNVSFKHLRKTYITSMVNLLGEKGSLIKHTQVTTSIKNYLDKKELVKDAKDIKLYDVGNWLS